MSSFLEALKKQSDLTQQRNVVPTLKKIEPISISIDLILSSNTIELTFSSEPSKPIRDALFAKGFGTPISSRFGLNYCSNDTQEIRRWLNEFFKLATPIDLEEKNSSIGSGMTEPEIVVAQSETSEEIEAPSNGFNLYKKQVAELCAHLKVEACDLPLIAVDCLHKQTFSRDS